MKRCRGRGSERLRARANGAPNARAETREGPRPAQVPPPRTGPNCPAPMGGAGPRHGVQLGSPRGRNAAAQPDWVKRERSAGRENAAAVYSEANLDGSAMAAGRGGDHAPVSIELAALCRGAEHVIAEAADRMMVHCTIANHGRPHLAGFGPGLISQHNSRRKLHREVSDPLATKTTWPPVFFMGLLHIATVTLPKTRRVRGSP